MTLTTLPLKRQCQANLVSDKIPKKLVLIFIIWKDKVKLNHHCREVGIEEPLQLASGGVDDAPAPLIEGEELGEDPEIDIDLGAFYEAEENVVVELENIELCEEFMLILIANTFVKKVVDHKDLPTSGTEVDA